MAREDMKKESASYRLIMLIDHNIWRLIDKGSNFACNN